MEPDNPSFFSDPGVAYLFRQDLDAAERVLKEAVRPDAKNDEVAHRLGRVAYARKDYSKAIEWHLRATEHVDHLPDYFVALGQAYPMAGKSEPARAAFDKAKAIRDRHR